MPQGSGFARHQGAELGKPAPVRDSKGWIEEVPVFPADVQEKVYALVQRGYGGARQRVVAFTVRVGSGLDARPQSRTDSLSFWTVYAPAAPWRWVGSGATESRGGRSWPGGRLGRAPRPGLPPCVWIRLMSWRDLVNSMMYRTSGYQLTRETPEQRRDAVRAASRRAAAQARAEMAEQHQRDLEQFAAKSRADAARRAQKRKARRAAEKVRRAAGEGATSRGAPGRPAS